MFAKKFFFEDKEMTNERLELTEKNSLYFLGPRLTLRNCTLVLKVPATRLLIREARFIDCTIEAKQELKNCQEWIQASLKGCRFKGRFSSCDFGNWPDYARDCGWEHGAIEDCDFTEARLDGCRFIGCDPSTLRFPRWPCFTVLDSVRRAPELSKLQWPGIHADVFLQGLSKAPARTAALALYAPEEAKRLQTTPEALRAVIETLDGVVC